MKCPRCEQENPARYKFCGQCATPLQRTAEAAQLLAPSYAEVQRFLTEALEQQTATSEILRLISRSPTDVQPVFEAIIQNALQLCGAGQGTVFRFDGSLIHVAAHHNVTPEAADVVRRVFPILPGRGSATGRAILTRAVVHVPDLASDFEHIYPELRAETLWNAVLSVPMLRDGVPIGAISVTRHEPGPFSDDKIELLKTFADQAVIAIENVRLFTELQQKNEALAQAHAQVTEALERQIATSEILGVISSSPTDVRPVFQAIARNAVALCGGLGAVVLRYDGTLLHVAAHHNVSAEAIAMVERAYPRRPARDYPPGRAFLDRTVVHVPNLREAPEFAASTARERGAASFLAVPLLREGEAIGVIGLARDIIGSFPSQQITLLQTFADQAVIAIENVRLFTELQEKNRALTQAHAQTTEALDQQTATSEILRVISSSPTDLQPVMDTIVENAARLTDAQSALIGRADGNVIHWLAFYGAPPSGPQPITRSLPSGRAILDRQTTQVEDIATIEKGQFTEPVVRAYREHGVRTVLATPLLRNDAALGVLLVRRTAVRSFTDKQIALLQTFADQAVIAIENVRVFNELETKNKALAETLQQQTATAEILRVISRSPTEVQPVFDTIVQSALRLLDAHSANLVQLERGEVHLAAITSVDPASDDAVRRHFPVPLSHAGVVAHVARTSRFYIVLDVETEALLSENIRRLARVRGYRSMLFVPMLHHGQTVGVIAVTRRSAGPFSDDEVGLLETFADQAVIAIENVRLFKELEKKNVALSEMLEQLTATADILRVISSSPTNAQPVFDAIVASVQALSGAGTSAVFLVRDGVITVAAADGVSPAWRAQYPRAITADTVMGRAVIERRALHVEDLESDLTYEKAPGRLIGVRTILGVPMLKDGEPVGVIAVWRGDVKPFSAQQITLLEAFADQAVIAIENVRLFKELEARTAELARSVDQLTALGDVGRAVSSTLDLGTVLTTIVSRAVELSGLDGGVVLEYDDNEQQFVHRAQAETGGTLAAARRGTRIRKGEGVIGRTAITLEPVQLSDITVPGAYVGPNRDNLIEAGVRAILAVPMVRESELIGCLGVTRNQPGEFPAETIKLLRTFATQSALAIQNARLYEEIGNKSRQLEAASQHKSEFLANMSHELRTPLNAIIGFSEVLAERMFGELNDKQEEYLKDIHASGQHLLSLINDILDLSKIEAGRMELELSDFDLPVTLDNALTLVRERAGRRGIALHMNVDERVGQVRADERKIRQVLLNLLSNAIKFTPEGGQIEIRATSVNGSIEVSVSDTGIGIAPEDQEAIFEEFQQVGTAAKKVEGTGLGLALSRKFIELHGGRISVQSELGAGSTFTFTLPLRHGE